VDLRAGPETSREDGVPKPVARPRGSFLRSTFEYFKDNDPTFRSAFGPALLLTSLLFVRSPWSNYIFDEQEALLANPYVNGKIPFKDLFHRDFWGLPHDRSIGSYRPLPNLVWRGFWQLGVPFHHPWALHWVNILVHALNAVLVARITLGLTKQRNAAWLAGAVFATCAVLTEAVTGVVGIADVFGALGLLGALAALEASLPKMAAFVFASVLLGLFAKESTLVAVPIVTFTALAAAPLHHPERPLRVLRAATALVMTVGALALYTEVRRRNFPSELPTELLTPLPRSDPWIHRAFVAFLKWFQQPRLPQDPINNPLINADKAHRVSGALGVYASGIGQVLFPWRISGDYSFAAEPIPARVVNARSVAGAVLLVGPALAGLGSWIGALFAERAGLVTRARILVALAVALVWVPVAYFPHSNIPVSLPTVRADRFWYLPAAGAALGLGVVFARLLERPRSTLAGQVASFGVVFFLVFQGVRARMHALDYMDDLVFWRATARAVPASAKAHLNYGVMLGARGKLDERLVENRRAMEIAPAWPMAHIYYADTLCRLNRANDAWPIYRQGLILAPNDRNLIALALQCLWDHGAILSRDKEIIALADKQPGSWLAWLARDVVANGPKNGGVDKKYRPRGYDEGPTE
jgi:tetratricopeptide (TPR) repeat protein